MNPPTAAPAPLVPIDLPEGSADDDPALEQTLAAVEARLARLADALLQRDLTAIDLESTELQRALTRAVEQFSRAARSAPVPAALRHRLARTGGQVAAQRESFARATAALDRAIDVLLPREAPALYRADGARPRASLGGSIRA